MKGMVLAALAAGSLTLGGISPPAYATSTKTVHATGGLDQTVPNCGDGTVNAYFVITQVDTPAHAPGQISVTFSNDLSATEPLLTVNGHTAKYQGPVPQGVSVSGATAVIYSSWSGQFNLSHYFCSGVSTTTTTTSTTTPTTSTTLPQSTTTTSTTTPNNTTSTTTGVGTTTTTTGATTTTTPGTSTSTVPPTAPGTNTPTPSSQQTSAAVPTGLAFTGSRSQLFSIAAAILIGLGSGLVAWSKRRRK